MAKKKLKKIRKVLILLFLIIMLFSIYKIYEYYKQFNNHKNLNNEMKNQVISENNQNEIPIKVDFEKLEQQNKDVIGWIYSENTPINYPIVQGNDNNYYLKKSIDGSYNSNGTIFLDYRNNKNFSDYISIIYGHNMKTQEMFGTLVNYEKQQYYEEHQKIYILTKEQNYKIELIAGYVASSDEDMYMKGQEYIENEKQNSTFKSEISTTQNDKFIVLSTCSYEYKDARYVLIGKSIKIN